MAESSKHKHSKHDADPVEVHEHHTRVMPKCPVKVGKTFAKIWEIGNGAFGAVYGLESHNGELAALKSSIVDESMRCREIKVLIRLNHHNCVKMRSHFKSKDKETGQTVENIVMEYLPENVYQYGQRLHDLSMNIPIPMVKVFAYQMFCGLNHMHQIGYIHRDIKPSNLLIDSETGVLKICDFGSAKRPKPGVPNTSYIGSRPYRAPECIFGSETYGFPIDIWAGGCVITQMLNGVNPVFASTNTPGMIENILRALDVPTEQDIKDMEVKYTNTSKPKVHPLEHYLPKHTPPDILDLLKKIFVYSPVKRLTAEQCMKHPCFEEIFKMKSLPNGHPMPKLDPVPN